MKNIIFALSLFTILFNSCNKPKEYDTRAIDALDKLSDNIGELSSVSFTLNLQEVLIDSTEHNTQSDVYMDGPKKMYMHSTGTKGEKGFWYNGTKFSYLSYDREEYDIIEAPDNILKLIDEINNKFGIDFPAADFFNPNITDDIMAQYNSVLYAGEEIIDNVECVSIEAANNEEILQIWIEKETNLPFRLLIESKGNNILKYDAIFSNWRVNPNLPDILFEFQPLDNSIQVKFQKK